jgi:putative oxidoreductase
MPVSQTDFSKYALLTGRILLAAIFILSGLDKMANPEPAQAMLANAHLSPSLVWPAIFVEFVGGVLLAFGYGTRIAAVMLAAFTLAAGLIFHYVANDAEQANNFFKNAAIIGGLSYVVAFGAGPLALGQLGWRKSEPEDTVEPETALLPDEAIPTG